MGFFKSAFADLNNYTRGFFGTVKPLEEVNPDFRRFTDLSVEDENVMRRSLIEQFFKESDKSPYQVSGYDITSYTNFIYGAIATEKPARLRSYRTMAEFPEVAGAIDEICDSMMCYDEDGNIMKLIVKNQKNLTGTKEIEVRKQFNQYLSLFSMDYNFYDFCRTFIIEGQLSWENVIGDDPTDGIIGINYIPNDFYDFLIDQNGNKKGIIVKTPKILRSQSNQVQMQGNIQLMDPSSYGKMKNPDTNKENKIAIVAAEGLPLPFDQITYIDSGLYTADKMIVFPILEKSRKAYRQLTLIEDSILIYRLVRAPERLVFNVATGKLPLNRAVQEVFKIMKRYQTKKFYNPSTGGVSNDYDPHQMSENLWFPRPEGTEGTSVTTIGGNVNWTQLPDLDYFLKKLLL